MCAEVVRRHHSTGNAQQTLIDLVTYHRESALGQAYLGELRQSIHTLRLDSTWTKSQVSFLVKFHQLVYHYNCNRPPNGQLAPHQLKDILRAAVYPAENLRAVQTREVEATIGPNPRPPFTYTEYFFALETAATLYDNHPRRKSHRQGHVVNTASAAPDTLSDAPGDDTTDSFREVHATDSTPTPRVPSDIWTKLSQDDRKAWSQIKPEGRRLLLPALRSANVIMSDVASSESAVDDAPSPDDTAADDETATASESREAHTSSQKPVADAHPGDPARVLSSRNSTGKASTKRSGHVTMVTPSGSSIDDAVATYWSTSSDSHALPDF